jgi:hypothetical protein
MVVQDATRANFKPRDHPGGRHASGGRAGSGRRPPPRGDRAVRPVQGEGRPVGARPHGRESRRSHRGGHRGHADVRGGGQDHHLGRPGPGDGAGGGPGDAVSPRALDGPGLRRQGRGDRRRPGPAGAHGGHQPPLHRGLPRGRRGPQPAGRCGGRINPPRRGHRSPVGYVAPSPRRERPGPPAPRRGAGGPGPRRTAGVGVRDHRGLGSDGHPGDGHLSGRPP